jgi:hypothetical protein
VYELQQVQSTDAHQLHMEGICVHNMLDHFFSTPLTLENFMLFILNPNGSP